MKQSAGALGNARVLRTAAGKGYGKEEETMPKGAFANTLLYTSLIMTIFGIIFGIVFIYNLIS